MKTLVADIQVLSNLVRGARGAASSAVTLDKFYGPQAGHYDQFRERLLHGRRELIERADLPAGGVWLDLGAGTGANLEFCEAKARACRRIMLLDLCRSLLNVAQTRIESGGWENVECYWQSALEFEPPEKADLITLSYSLTMMSQWRTVLERAHRWLNPGGRIAVVDFYVSTSTAPPDRVQHGWMTRTFWRKWFLWDGVHLNGKHLSYLDARFSRTFLTEARAKVPYLPIAKVPYYIFVGERR